MYEPGDIVYHKIQDTYYRVRELEGDHLRIETLTDKFDYPCRPSKLILIHKSTCQFKDILNNRDDCTCLVPLKVMTKLSGAYEEYWRRTEIDRKFMKMNRVVTFQNLKEKLK